MRYGISVPNFGELADVRATAALAADAERAGWDGFFVWDHIQFARGNRDPVANPWILLAAIALATERIALGPLVTPVPRRRPWQVAREVTTLDRLSAGRVVFGVGLGEPGDAEYGQFGEDPDPKVRAAKLDEALELLVALWTGEPVRFHGDHYTVDGAVFQPTPAQRPHPPIWVAGLWPHRRPMRRAARFDGAFPIGVDGTTPEVIREVVAYTAAHRPAGAAGPAGSAARPFDVVAYGMTAGRAAADVGRVEQFAAAGATWWMEDLNLADRGYAEIADRIRTGPPTASASRSGT